MTENIMVSRELLRQVLDALQAHSHPRFLPDDLAESITALRAALEQPAATTEKRVAWVAYTNQDLTEGRGRDIPIAVCMVEATAKRLARKRYVQGSDGPVRPIEMVKIGSEWYAPKAASILIEPTKDDIALQAAMDAKNDAVAKAKAHGLTASDLAALMGGDHESN